MTLARRRWFAGLTLLAFALAGAAWLLRLDYAAKISTDVLDLIPDGERAPELALVRTLASDKEARTMLFVLTTPDGAAVPVAAAQRFAAELRRAPVFGGALAMGDSTWRDAVGRELFASRFALLFPGWLQGRRAAPGGDTTPGLARAAARELKTFLERPEAVAYQDLVTADPLLLLPHVLERMKGGAEVYGGGAGSGLVWAQLSVSPLREEGQGPAFAAIERAREATAAELAGIRVAYTGVNRFAAESRRRIESEVGWLNALSLAAVLGVAAVFIRALHRALHLVPVVAFAVLGAWVATTASFERVHVIVFVLGALLTGVAIDYGFYLFMQPPARPDEEYPDKVRRLAKPLLASCGTTVAGFALLLFSDFPMIRQLGVFVGAGLVCALLAAVLYFALLRNTFLPARAMARRREREAGATRRRKMRWVLIGLWVAALAGLARLTWRDDIRELEVPAPELMENDARIRSAFGQSRDRAVFLTHGATLDEARDALVRFERWTGERARLANLGAVFPAPSERIAAAQWAREQPGFVAELTAALEAEGFEAGEFAPFFTSYREWAGQVTPATTAEAMQRVQARLPGPLGLLVHVGAERSWFVSIADRPIGEPPAETQTVAASQLQSLNRLFAGYRASALQLSLAGLALVGLGVLLTYGVRDGVRIFAIPCGACLGIFGLFGWSGQPLNLFHLLGAFLGVCLTHNYAIFSATSAFRGEAPPVSVRLSALTTGASFGVLALSSIPVVRALGLTVAAMVFAALLVIELEHLSPLGKETSV